MNRFDRHELRSVMPVCTALVVYAAVAHCSCGADLWGSSYHEAQSRQVDHAVAELHAALEQIVEV